jgi:broad specificity phosphatase PhoE
MFAHREDNGSVQDFANLLQSYDFGALVDEIASADPPAFLHRCFAEGLAAPRLSHAHVQELAGCAIVLDALLNERSYTALEPELIADWREHYGKAWAPLDAPALAALHRAAEQDTSLSSDASAELAELQRRLRPDPH